MSTATPAPPAPAATASLQVHRGWIVTFAGTGINLALGILYTWSMFKTAIAAEFGWQGSRLNDPYALCCLVFAFSMIVAGRCQDRFGPRRTAAIGGLLVGAGFLLCSTTTSYAAWLLGFGVLAGIGIGFGYSSATPAALKWFPPARTGLIAGLVVAGFGLAPVFLAPAAQHLLAQFQVRGSMLILGIAFAAVVCGLAQLLTNPEQASPPGAAPRGGPPSGGAPVNAVPSELMRQPAFWLLWAIYFIGAGAGLMVISSISGMARNSMGELAFVAVAILAVGNAGGRIAAGSLSDRIGRRWMLCIVLGFQALLMVIAIPVVGAREMAAWVLVTVAALIGANYGANLALFPSFTKDLWGLKNFGKNYGVLFTAWGMGGLILSRLQQMLTERSHGSYTSSFVTAGVLLLLATALTFLIEPSRRRKPAV